MAKKKGKKRIADHRNHGFTAVDAMFEHNVEKTAAINKQIITKPGLHMYSDEEIATKSGAVITLNYNEPYTWAEFKRWSDQNKREYLKHLCGKYPDIRSSEFGAMFGVAPVTFRQEAARLGIVFPSGGRRTLNGAEAFMRDMVSEKPELESEPEVPMTYEVHDMTLSCDVEAVSDLLKQFGFSGRIYITVRAESEGDDDE